MTDDHQTIQLDPDDLGAARQPIKKAIETQGFAVLESWDTSTDALRRIGSLFGTLQSHIRANEEGVVGVGGPQPVEAEWHKYRSEYHGLGTDAFSPHTDGTFVDGAVVRGTSVLRVGPPRFVILHVVRHADVGGANLVVDAQRIFDDLIETDPESLATLLSPGSISFCRDDQLALDKQVYRLVGDRHVKVRFRGDSKAYSPSWALGSIEKLKERYHLNPDYYQEVRGEAGQVLVMDNTRVLHGRKPFVNGEDAGVEGRKLHRLWILDEDEHEPGLLANLDRQVPQSRALEAYEPYGPVENEMAVADSIVIDTGIRVHDAAVDEVTSLLGRVKR